MNPHLPPELIRPIVLYASSHGYNVILSLILTCRLFRSEAETVLYRSINTGGLSNRTRFLEARPDIKPLSPHEMALWGTYYTSKYTQLLETLKENQRLADLVHAFNCYLGEGLVRDEPFWSLFSDALSKLHNLKVFLFNPVSSNPSGWVLEECTFQLERFEWHGYEDEEHLIPFLSRQHTLQHLSVDWSDTVSLVPPTILPNLATLSGTQGAALAFLPGRRVKELTWLADRDDPELTSDMVSAIASDLEYLYTFQLGGDLIRPGLSVFAPHLTRLRRLNLVGVEQGEDSSIIMIRSLEHLKLSLLWGVAGPDNALWFINVDEQMVYLANLFDWLENLRVVDVESAGRERCFHRFLRGQVQSPRKITGSINEW